MFLSNKWTNIGVLYIGPSFAYKSVIGPSVCDGPCFVNDQNRVQYESHEGAAPAAPDLLGQKAIFP